MKPTNEDIQHQYGVDQNAQPSQPLEADTVYRNSHGAANQMGNMAQQMNWHQPVQQFAMNQNMQHTLEYGSNTQPFASQEYGSNTQPFASQEYGSNTQPFASQEYGNNTQPFASQEYGNNTQPFAQAEANQFSQQGAMKEKCRQMKDHHVEVKMANGQSVDGILTEVREDGITVLVGEDVHQEESRQFGWRYRRYRRRFFPFGGFTGLGFFPYFFPPFFFY
ncbi:hypothetical protein J32TS2_05200 [Shouchella clausii]|uniref:Uncharacterized protein n=1 Tax=Shouchella rhizosphaerae TaxID=866786 RepID=A0ABZ2CV78_9BACI|nr:hypothetical protein [Shouchella clausii]ALA53914.1 hypothetical protein DB29_03086 [Shouchella clausii]MBX0307478.1 hypothetical protein [Shouchella clausii]UXN53977.1 hypothetical protein N7M99_16465 [Shouchella clausii]GIN15164.1 hypothetical protein J32TS2_05200 [Shouchella clausii]